MQVQYVPSYILLVAVLILGMATTAVGQEAAPPSERAQQRQAYAQAQDALQKRQMARYREQLPALKDYPLLPYLVYTDLSRRLQRLPEQEVTAFLVRYPDSLLAERLESQWLRTLASQRKWPQYLTFFRRDTRDAELNCYYLLARLNTGDDTALLDVAPLWNVEHSQPDACDPLFDRWMRNGLLTPEIAWERHSKALKARNLSLAGFIARQLPEEQQRLADLYRQVDRQPSLLRQQNRFSAQSPQMQEVILHGLERLALRDAPLALELWGRYDAQQLFDDRERLDIQHHIASRLMRQGHRAAAEQLLAEVPRLSSDSLVEWMVRDSLRRQEWSKVDYWISMLPSEARQSNRWRYWQARALQQLDPGPDQGQEARRLLTEVADTRSFYGFLAADRLDMEYRLLDLPVQPEPELMLVMELHPAIQRARELYILGEITDASREWFHAIRQMDTDAILAAGKLAEQWGWHRKGIHAMIQARSWDDLQLRFPLAYQEQVAQAAEETAINPHLLFAIARQESAFTPDARSPAGALGLMQLMPATAQYTARRAGIPYRQHDLLTPETNINLGSRYLHQLLNEFNGNRILAAAAYNAGPGRVRQWLSKQEEEALPYDIWIETIPFQETRGYVQNVLAFSVIYGYRMGESLPLITTEEANKPL